MCQSGYDDIIADFALLMHGTQNFLIFHLCSPKNSHLLKG